MGEVGPIPSLEQLLTLQQASRLSGLSPSQLRLLVGRGDLWGIKLGRNWFTTADAVSVYLAKGVKPGPKPKSPLEKY
jgi:hypothetical protein